MEKTFTRPPSDWAALSVEQLQALVKATNHTHYAHNDLILVRGEPIVGPTALLSGAAYFFYDNADQSRDELAQLRWGGEILMVSLVPGTWPVSLRAVGSAVVAVIPFEPYERIMQSTVGLGQLMLTAVVNQVLRDYDRAALRRGMVVDRMAALLHALAAYTGIRRPGGYLLDYPLRLTDLSTLIGAHPVECSRALTALRARGFIEKRPKFRLFVRGLEVVQPDRNPVELAFASDLW